MNGTDQMPLPNASAALLAALVAATPTSASDQKDGPAPASERLGDTVPSTDKEALTPPAFHAPGPDVGMREPFKGPKSPVWNPPAADVPGKKVSPN